MESQTPVQYITITGPTPNLPENPFIFIDDLLLKTDDELQKMDMSSLIKYTSSISTSISLEASTLKVNQSAQASYLVLKLESQRIIDELDNEIAMNKALIDSYTEFADLLDYDNVSTAYVSTMAQYEYYIAQQQLYLTLYNSSLSSYIDIASQLEVENAIYNADEKLYMSLYTIYDGYKTQYDATSLELDTVTLQLRRAEDSEQASYIALEESTIRLQNVSQQLVRLRQESVNIDYRIAVCRREEARTFINYTSSLDALNKISSVYLAAVANEDYALAILQTTALTTEYSDAIGKFNEVDLQYTNSVRQAAGDTGVSGAIKGDSVLWAARSMAYSKVQKAEADKVASENATAKLENLAGLANTKAYETMLLGYDDTILAYATNEQKFRNYKLASLDLVNQFSSIYEQSILDINMYTEQISQFSSFYESSIAGASTLLNISEIELSTIEGDTLDYYAVSWSISTLNEQYSTCLYELDEAVQLSTLYQTQYLDAVRVLQETNDYHDSTNKTVLGLTYDLYGTTGSNGLINVYNNSIFTYSSILNKELINAKVYDTQIKEYVTLQDVSMYQYRETYCRTTRQQYQTDYESKVYVEVQYAQSLTDSEQANSPPGVSVTPISANLTTPVIKESYSKLVSMYSFLDLFTDIYTTYDSQIYTINTLSTSVGGESSAFSTLDFYTKAQYANRQWAIRTYGSNIMNNISNHVTTSCDTFTAAQVSTSAILGIYAVKQSTINMKKSVILSSLQKFYSASEIAEQNSKLSSFIIESISEASTLLYSQGII
jgi:hypothetical protein